MLPVGLVERAAYRDIYEFGAVLSELDPGTTSGLLKAQDNASELADAVVAALKRVSGMSGFGFKKAADGEEKRQGSST
jgi:hypothetical protein